MNPSCHPLARSEADREAARHMLTLQPDLGRCVPRLTPSPIKQRLPAAAANSGAAGTAAAGGGAAGSGGGGGLVSVLSSAVASAAAYAAQGVGRVAGVGDGGGGGGGGLGDEDPLAAHGMLLEAAGPWLRRVTAAWQRGALSNFDYLLYLNFAAGEDYRTHMAVMCGLQCYVIGCWDAVEGVP